MFRTSTWKNSTNPRRSSNSGNSGPKGSGNSKSQARRVLWRQILSQSPNQQLPHGGCLNVIQQTRCKTLWGREGRKLLLRANATLGDASHVGPCPSPLPSSRLVFSTFLPSGWVSRLPGFKECHCVAKTILLKNQFKMELSVSFHGEAVIKRRKVQRMT